MNSCPITRQQNQPGLVEVTAQAKKGAGKALAPELCQVIEEDALTIVVNDVGTYTLMYTPTQAVSLPMAYFSEYGLEADNSCPEMLAFSTGFLLTEGIINCLDDIRAMSVCADEPSIVKVTLFNPEQVEIRRKDVMMTSSCGICGGREAVEQSLNHLPKVTQTLTCQADSFSFLMQSMQSRQEIFNQCGGSHAAAIFDGNGKIVVLCEDLGRHNALDKAIGSCLLQGIDLKGKGLLLSSRLSLEMVSKAAIAGIELIAAVSAPTSMAINIAENCGITLCGFVRQERLTAFTHPDRVVS
jgi:FdhD protein